MQLFRYKRLSRNLSMLLSTAILFSLLAPFFSNDVSAATSRVAKITGVTGDAEITKSGGSKPYKAFKGLFLNQGDHIKTGSKSSLVIEVEDRKDEVTIGPNSELYVSQLKEEDGSKNTSFKMWSGSMLTKASKLVDTKDSFEVETPTAVMGVRGTNFLTVVDFNAKFSQVVVLSGVVRADPAQLIAPSITAGKPEEKPQSPVYIYPTQQINLYETQGQLNNTVTYADPQLVAQQSPEILKALIKNKSAIDQENQTFTTNLANGAIQPPPNVLSGQLQQYQNNVKNGLDGLFGNAVNNGLLKAEELKKIISDANQETGQNINVDLNKTLNLSAEEEQKIKNESKKVEERRTNINTSQTTTPEKTTLAKTITDTYLAQTKAIEKKAEEKSQQAAQQYQQSLLEKERLAFQQRQQQLQEQAKSQTSPITTPTPGSGSGSGSTQTASDILNSASSYSGNVTLSVSGSTSQTFGPSSVKTITGDVTINGTATGTVTLRNLAIGGKLTVNIPDGTLKLDSTVIVIGQTIVQNVKAGTFDSEANHGGIIDVRDLDGTQIRLNGHASAANVEITGGGAVMLSGTFLHEIKVKAAGANLSVSSGSSVASLDIQAANVGLTNNGIVDGVRTSNGSTLKSEVLTIKTAIDAKLNAINAATSATDLQSRLTAHGFTVTNYQASLMFTTMPFDSIAEIRHMISVTPTEDEGPSGPTTVPVIEYKGSSPIHGDTLTVYTKDAKKIYMIPEYSFHSYDLDPKTISLEDLEMLVEDNYGFSQSVSTDEGNKTVELSTYFMYGGTAVLYAANDYHASSFKQLVWKPGETTTGQLSGTLTLPAPAPAGGVEVMVFAKSYYDVGDDGDLPIEIELGNLDIRSYEFITIPENSASAAFSLEETSGDDFIIGYSIISDLPVGNNWIKQGYLNRDSSDKIVSYAENASELTPGISGLNLNVPSGDLITGNIRLDSSYSSGSQEVYVLIKNASGDAGFAILPVTSGTLAPFEIAVPNGSSYFIQYFVKGEYPYGKTLYYKGEEQYTFTDSDAVGITADATPTLLIPGNSITGVVAKEFATEGFRIEWDRLTGADDYEVSLFDEMNDEISLDLDKYDFDGTEPRLIRYASDLLYNRSESDAELEPNHTYKVVITAYDNELDEILGMSIISFTTGSVLPSRPKVTRSLPGYGANAVLVSTPLRFTFDQPITLADNSLSFVTLLDSSELPVEGLEVSVENGDTLVISHNGLSLDSYYDLYIEPQAVWNTQGITNTEFSWQFKTSASNQTISSVTSAVYEDSIAVNWGAYSGADYYVVSMDGGTLHNVGSTDYVLTNTGIAKDHAILVQAFNAANELLAETEIYVQMPSVTVYDAIARPLDGLILTFSWLPVTGASEYVIYNEGSYMYDYETIEDRVEFSTDHIQVNYPGVVSIVALDSNGRVLAASKVNFIIEFEFDYGF